MSLRFQEQDEVDREIEEGSKGSLFLIIFGLIFLAAILGLGNWLGGQALRTYLEELGALIAGAILVFPFYITQKELNIRVKEIDGKVSAIETALSESKAREIELLGRLTTVQNVLDEIQASNRQ